MASNEMRLLKKEMQLLRDRLKVKTRTFSTGSIVAANPLTNEVTIRDASDPDAEFVTNVQSGYVPEIGHTVVYGFNGGDVFVMPPQGPMTSAIPTKAAGVVVTGGARSLRINWTPPTDFDVINNRGQFHVQIATNTGFTTGLVERYSATTQVTITGLTTGILYYVRVRAQDAAGMYGEWSLTASGAPVAQDMADLIAALGMQVGQYISSTSYVAGSSGWRILADGTAEFSSGTFRGFLEAETVSARGSGVNVLTDGGFELNTAVDWNVLTQCATVGTSLVRKRTGIRSLELTKTAVAGGQCEVQTDAFAASSGVFYELSFYSDGDIGRTFHAVANYYSDTTGTMLISSEVCEPKLTGTSAANIWYVKGPWYAQAPAGTLSMRWTISVGNLPASGIQLIDDAKLRTRATIVGTRLVTGATMGAGQIAVEHPEGTWPQIAFYYSDSPNQYEPGLIRYSGYNLEIAPPVTAGVARAVGINMVDQSDHILDLRAPVITINGVDDILGAWFVYAPTLTATTTNPTIGNGVLVGRYKIIGKMVWVRIYWSFGSTSVAGSGSYQFALPLTSHSSGKQVLAGFLDDSASRFPVSGIIDPSTLLVSRVAMVGGGTGLSAASITWGAGDIVVLEGVYEAA